MTIRNCTKTWGICPVSNLIPSDPTEPHVCFHFVGHRGPHTCGTCEAELPLDDNEMTCLEEPPFSY